MVHLLNLNLRNVTCYLLAFFLALWCLGNEYPGTDISYFIPGILLFFFISPFLLIGRKIRVPHAPIYIGFVVMHFVLVNPLVENPHFITGTESRLLFCFITWIILINVIDDIRLYRRFLIILMVTLVLLMIWLDIVHLLIYRSSFLSTNFLAEDFARQGRVGKNSLSLFLSLLFPFFFSRFFHRKTLWNLFALIVIAFSIIYTVSRAALLSLVLSVALFNILAIRRWLYVNATLILCALYILSSTYLGIGYKTFLQMKAGANVFYSDNWREQQEVEGQRFITYTHSRRGHHLQFVIDGFVDSPFFGHGASAFHKAAGTREHNDYLAMLYNFGLLGLLLFIAMGFTSFRDIWRTRHLVPPEHQWLWEAHVVMLPIMYFQILFVNLYETIPFWLTLGGCHLLQRAFEKEPPETIKSPTKINQNGIVV